MYCTHATPLLRPLGLITSVLLLFASSALAQTAPAPGGRGGGRGSGEQIGSIDERTSGFKKIDGFFPLYWDDAVAGEITGGPIASSSRSTWSVAKSPA